MWRGWERRALGGCGEGECGEDDCGEGGCGESAACGESRCGESAGSIGFVVPCICGHVGSLGVVESVHFLCLVLIWSLTNPFRLPFYHCDAELKDETFIFVQPTMTQTTMSSRGRGSRDAPALSVRAPTTMRVFPVSVPLDLSN